MKTSVLCIQTAYSHSENIENITLENGFYHCEIAQIPKISINLQNTLINNKNSIQINKQITYMS